MLIITENWQTEIDFLNNVLNVSVENNDDMETTDRLLPQTTYTTHTIHTKPHTHILSSPFHAETQVEQMTNSNKVGNKKELNCFH